MGTDQTKGTIEERLNAYHVAEAGPKADEVKQPAPTPSAEQKPAEEEVKAPEVPVTVDEEKVALENSKNPERTKEYIDKLKRELQEARTPKAPVVEDKENYGESAFAPFQAPVQEPVVPSFNGSVNAPYLNPQQVQNIRNQFVDAQGNVDINGLNQALNQANMSAYEARQKVQTLEQKLARFEENAQVKEAHAQYPEIDPLNKEKFDKKLYGLVRDRLLYNMYRGTKETLLEVARDIVGVKQSAPVAQVPDNKEVGAKAVEDYKRAQAARNQGPFESGRGESRQEDATIDELRKASRGKGQSADAAIGERLKRLGI